MMFGKRRKQLQEQAEHQNFAATRQNTLGLGARLRQLFTRNSSGTPDFFDELEDLLVEADLGPALAVQTRQQLEEQCKKARRFDSPSVLQYLSDILEAPLGQIDLTPRTPALHVYLVLGVNGAGKTSVIGKMAHRFKPHAGSIVLAAADTFRAAANEQLGVHADRSKARLVSQQPGADPAAVIFDAIHSAISRGDSLVLADTAGRMHNRVNLVAELEKINRTIVKSLNRVEHVYRKILVIDATTGQNGLRQTELFHQAIGVDALVLAKYDSTAKGGILASIAREFSIPVAYLGCGEGPGDLLDFNARQYVRDLLGQGSGQAQEKDHV